MSRGWLAVFVIAPLAASAADPDEIDQASGRKIHYQERTELEFQGIDVNGEIARPSVAVINELPKLHFPSLYHPRVEFTDAMKSAVDEVK